MPARIAAIMIAAPAAADTLTFEADEEVVVVRGADMFGGATSEFVGEPGAVHQCPALDGSGEPIAAANAMADAGQIIFTDLPLGSVDRVECRTVL